METDKQLYTLLGAAPEFLRVLTDGITVEGPYRFEAIDVKALERRLDGVLLPQAAQETIWVMESQGRWDALIYHRLLVKMGLVGERNAGRVVRGLLLFTAKGHDPRTEPWHSLLQERPHGPIRRVYLPEVLARLAREAPEHPLLGVFLPYQEDDRDRLREQAPRVYRQLKQAPLAPTAREQCLGVFQSWLMARFQELKLEEILKMLGELTPLEETRAYKELVAIGEAQGRKEGHKEGHREGHREGRQEEAAALVLRLLGRRFGLLPAPLQGQIGGLEVDRLEALGEALLDFAAVADLKAWLEGQSKDRPH